MIALTLFLMFLIFGIASGMGIVLLIGTGMLFGKVYKGHKFHTSRLKQ